MRFAFLTFEAVLTIVWYVSAIWMFGMVSRGDGDWGTIVGGLLFLAFGIGTTWMLVHEAILLFKQRTQDARP
jgi:hypothetical protein